MPTAAAASTPGSLSTCSDGTEARRKRAERTGHRPRAGRFRVRPEEGAYFLNEALECGLVFQDQMVSAFERDEARSGYARGHASPRFERHPCILPGMHDQRRNLDLGEKRRDIGVAIGDEIANGIRGGRGNPLQLVEPVDLFLGAVGNELRREHLAKRRILLTPPDAREGEHGFSRLFVGLGSAALAPADGVAAEEYEVRDALGMPHGVANRNGAPLRYTEKSEALDTGRIDDRLEVIDEIFKRDVGNLAV